MRTWWHWRAPCSTIRAGAGMPPTFWGARLPIRRPMTAASQACGRAAAARGRTRREPRRPERRLQPAGSVPDTQLAQIAPIGDAEFVRAHMQLGAEVDGDALRTLGFDDLAILLEHRILAPAISASVSSGPKLIATASRMTQLTSSSGCAASIIAKQSFSLPRWAFSGSTMRTNFWK